MMSKDKFQEKYRIDSARAKWHDYDDGYYFVTICTQNRECFFGTIINNEMILSETGEYANQQLLTFSEHNKFVEILSYVVMPNHIHLILAIDKTKLSHKKRDNPIIPPVETFHETSHQAGASQTNNFRNAETLGVVETSGMKETFHPVERFSPVETFHETSLQRERTEQATKQQSWLSVAIRLFKQSVTRFANQNGILFGWQERFHDHIIRNQKEMDYITEYIENNVKNWNEDLFHKI